MIDSFYYIGSELVVSVDFKWELFQSSFRAVLEQL